MRSKRLKWAVRIGFLLVLLSVSFLLFLEILLNRPGIQRFLIREISRATGYEIETGDLHVYLGPGLGFSAEDVQVKWAGGAFGMEASRARVGLHAGELLRGRIRPERIVLIGPRIDVGDTTDQRSLLKTMGDDFPAFLGRFLGGVESIALLDARISLSGLPWTLEAVRFHASREPGREDAVGVHFEARVSREHTSFPLSLRGTIRNLTAVGRSPELALVMEPVPLDVFPATSSLYGAEGTAAVRLRIAFSKSRDVSVEGRIESENPRLVLVSGGREKSFSFSRLAAEFEALIMGNVVRGTSLKMEGPGFSVAGRFGLDLQNRKDPYVSLNIRAPYMAAGVAKKVFPGPLTSSWLEEELFPAVESGLFRLESLSLGGPLERLRDIDLPENADLFSMTMLWKDTRISPNGGIPFREVSGRMTIADGRLELSETEGAFGNSRVKSAGLITDLAHMDSAAVDLMIDGDFQIPDVVRQKDVEGMPEYIRRRLALFSAASGSIQGSATLRSERRLEDLQVQAGDLVFRDCAYVNESLRLPIVLERGFARTRPGESWTVGGAGSWGRSPFEFSGSISPAGANASLDVHARLDAGGTWHAWFPNFAFPAVAEDPVPLNLSVSGSPESWSYRAEMNLEGMSMQSKFVSIAPPGNMARLVLKGDVHAGKEIRFREVSCRLGRSRISFEGTLALSEGYPVRGEISGPGLRMKDLGFGLGRSVDFEHGEISCRGTLEVFLKGGASSVFSGKVVGQDIGVAAEALPSPIRDLNFELDLSQDGLHIRNSAVLVGKSDFRVKGSLEGWDRVKGGLTAESERLILSDVLPERETAFPFQGPPAAITGMGNTDLGINFDAGEVEGVGTRFGPVSAACRIHQGRLDIERLRMKVRHGYVNVRGQIGAGKRGDRLYTVYFRLKEQPVDEFLMFLGMEDLQLTGPMFLEGVLYMRGAAKEDLISSLQGRANVSLERGKILRSHTLIKILDFMSLQKIYKGIPEDLSKEGLYYESIEGHIRLDQGVLATDPLVMKSPVFNAVVKGNVDLRNGRVNAEVGAQPLGSIDSLISRIPIAGHILTGEDKAFLVYIFHVEGPVSEPSVRHVPLKGLGKGVSGLFGRLLTTPGRLFKEISEAAGEIGMDGAPPPDMDVEAWDTLGP